jgi:hypothetical protein
VLCPFSAILCGRIRGPSLPGRMALACPVRASCKYRDTQVVTSRIPELAGSSGQYSTLMQTGAVAAGVHRHHFQAVCSVTTSRPQLVSSARPRGSYTCSASVSGDASNLPVVDDATVLPPPATGSQYAWRRSWGGFSASSGSGGGGGSSGVCTSATDIAYLLHSRPVSAAVLTV